MIHSKKRRMFGGQKCLFLKLVKEMEGDVFLMGKSMGNPNLK